jgi:hypothetical protein
MAETPVSWIGSGSTSIPGLVTLGFQNFATEQGRQSVAAHDFMVTVAKADANPSTILEAMAWGLIPVCTVQSGYVNEKGIVNIPLDNVEEAVAILRRLQHMSEGDLLEMQAHNWRMLDEHYNWNRFAQQVIGAIESDTSPSPGYCPPLRRAYIRWLAFTSPYAAWRPFNLAQRVARRWRLRRPS